MKKRCLALIIILIPVMIFGDWEIEIPYADSSGRSAAIAVDGNNDPHIVYFTDADSFYHVYKSNDSWFGPYAIEKVDYSTYCRVIDIAMIADTAYALMCMEYTSSGDYLLLGKHTGDGVWITEQVPNTVVPSNSGGYLNVAIAPGAGSTLFHILYVFYNYGSPLLYHCAYDGTWGDPEEVGDIPNVSAGWQNDIAVDVNDDPHVAFVYSDEGIKYRKKTGGTWEPIELVSTSNDPSFASIAIDASQYPHIAYDKDDLGAVCYRAKTAAGWQPEETVGAGGGWNTYGASIGIYGWGRSIVYYSDGDMRYATRGTSNWTSEYVDTTGDVGTYASLAIDGQGFVHIAYRDATHEYLKYARSTEPMTGMREQDATPCAVFSASMIQTFPNPFTHAVEIRYQLPDDIELMDMGIYSTTGRRLASFRIEPSTHGSLSWNACGTGGRRLGSGVYFLRGTMRSAHDAYDRTFVKKLIIL